MVPSWFALGSGLNTGVGSSVHSISSIGSILYVGGSFTAGGVAANNIAGWNGSSWTALSSRTNGRVYSLTPSGIDMYAGGPFYDRRR
ncbi:MAG: hypothetical protein IPL53_00120 [Ignavibacteria bacterium]|nr:hypothetical protein [Ignavibacteria bacterium]